MPITIFLIILIIVVFISFIKTIVIVPNQVVFVVERLGKYKESLEAGLHILIPFFDKVRYKHTLKEQAIDVPPQVCITKDNISVEIDGVLYLKVVDPKKASYGIINYRFAITQLAQTTMRSEIGKIDLDKTFESRDEINSYIVRAVDEASDPWGIKVTRYEIKNIEPPQTIRDAMEKQMRAEREKREKIALSEGDRQARINRSEGIKTESIQVSEGKKIQMENEAKGNAAAIYEVAKATALGITEIAKSINQPGGKEAVQLDIAKDWINSFSNLAKETNSMIIPTDVTDLASATSIIKKSFDFTKSDEKNR